MAWVPKSAREGSLEEELEKKRAELARLPGKIEELEGQLAACVAHREQQQQQRAAEAQQRRTRSGVGSGMGPPLGPPPGLASPGPGETSASALLLHLGQEPTIIGGASHAPPPATLPGMLPQKKPSGVRGRRLLIPFDQPDPPKKAKKAAGRGRGRAPAARTPAPKYTGPPYAGGPGELKVVCGNVRATLVWPAPKPHKPKEVVRLEDGKMVTPRDLEVKGGKAAAKSWKMSIRARDTNATLRSWLAGMGEAFVATHMTFNRARA